MDRLLADGKGFFGALFDFGFEHFITLKIVKLVYLLGAVVIAFGLLFFVVSGFASDEPLLGVLFLIVGPIGAIVSLAFVRMMLEMYYAVVRLSEDVHHRWR